MAWTGGFSESHQDKLLNSSYHSRLRQRGGHPGKEVSVLGSMTSRGTKGLEKIKPNFSHRELLNAKERAWKTLRGTPGKGQQLHSHYTEGITNTDQQRTQLCHRQLPATLFSIA
jgi:hypothetical protein